MASSAPGSTPRPAATRGSAASLVLRTLAGLLLVGLVVVAIAWLAGAFHPKVAPGRQPLTPAVRRPVADAQLGEVRTLRMPRVEQAVGTIRAVHETVVASRLLATVDAVLVRAGQQVAEGDVVARLEASALDARRRQTEAEIERVTSVLEKARADEVRSRELVDKGVAPRQELDDAVAAVRTAEAALEVARRTRDEAVSALGYATLTAPFTGVVVDRHVEPGDTVAPGQAILTLYEPTRMQLVASVRESLTGQLVVGEEVAVRIDALDLDCHGLISEIVPRATGTSRTFDVKVTGPCPPGVYSGMFGRLLVPLGEEEVLVAPAGAVHYVGQLTLVDVAADGALRRRAVQLGREFGDDIEVLAGLAAGERVALRDGD